MKTAIVLQVLGFTFVAPNAAEKLNLAPMFAPFAATLHFVAQSVTMQSAGCSLFAINAATVAMSII
jgi:hypothetical protein